MRDNNSEVRMKRSLTPVFFVLTLVLLSAFLQAQLDKIVIPAGTPEDQALQAISSEPDSQKKLTMYQDFLERFPSNPAAVAYGNWQISQSYQSAGDLAKALNMAIRRWPAHHTTWISWCPRPTSRNR